MIDKQHQTLKNQQHIDSKCISENLSIFLSERGISESDLASDLGLPYNTIKRLTSGVTSDPRISTLYMIADYLNISLDDLVKNQTNHDNSNNLSSSAIPIFKWNNVSQPGFFDTFSISQWPDWYPVPPSIADELSSGSYILATKSSMQPKYPLGTLLIIDPNVIHTDADIVLVQMNNDSSISLREVVLDPPTTQLLPIVRNSVPIEYDKSLHKIVGVVILTIFHRHA